MKILWYSNFNVHKKCFIGTHPHSFVSVSSVAVFVLWQQSQIEPYSWTPKYLLSGLFKKCLPTPDINRGWKATKWISQTPSQLGGRQKNQFPQIRFMHTNLHVEMTHERQPYAEWSDFLLQKMVEHVVLPVKLSDRGFWHLISKIMIAEWLKMAAIVSYGEDPVVCWCIFLTGFPGLIVPYCVALILVLCLLWRICELSNISLINVFLLQQLKWTLLPVIKNPDWYIQ